MNRNEKIRKLASAVKDYRGRYLDPTANRPGKWLVQPQPSALPRLKKAINRLGLPVAETVSRIEAFKSYAEFNNWIREL